jgi:hypothetical protein
MLRLFAIVFLFFLLGLSPASAAVECFPHCDYWHDYGPYDFTYKRPGLFGYPICGPRGDCAPHLAYIYQRGHGLRKRITIRTRSRVRPSP